MRGHLELDDRFLDCFALVAGLDKAKPDQLRGHLVRCSGGPCGSPLQVPPLVDIRATPRRPRLTLDLSEFEFDPCYAAEYLQRHLKPRTGLIDLLHDANEGREP